MVIVELSYCPPSVGLEVWVLSQGEPTSHDKEDASHRSTAPVTYLSLHSFLKESVRSYDHVGSG